MYALTFLLLLVPATVVRGADVVDKIAVVVETKAITDRQIRQELLYSSFLNGEAPDYGLESRREAASRLVDQILIRAEIEVGGYPAANAADAAKLLAGLKKRFPTEAAFRQALAKNGMDEKELMRRLEWQSAVLAFVSRRFATAQAMEKGGDAINESFFGWLDTTRKQTRIVYREAELKPPAKEEEPDDDEPDTPLPSNRPRRNAQ